MEMLATASEATVTIMVTGQDVLVLEFSLCILIYYKKTEGSSKCVLIQHFYFIQKSVTGEIHLVSNTITHRAGHQKLFISI